MTWEWSSYLEIARELEQASRTAEPERAEALLRTAASRAYYAAFHVAREWAKQHNGYMPTKTNAHQGLIDHFKRHGANRIEKQIGLGLGKARSCRENADYEDAITPPRTWETVAKNAIEYAEKILISTGNSSNP